ncbi:hypothetical protein [Actinomadura kijaniata]|uniref:hypothetical protein n=1 Tax=Actinomadura kijaniata TaxID=46161 RepID=UPI0012F8CDB1|nr:hypothetical protein [Actinomadura kijaniata]
MEFRNRQGARFLGGPTALGSGEDGFAVESVSFAGDGPRLFAARMLAGGAAPPCT